MPHLTSFIVYVIFSSIIAILAIFSLTQFDFQLLFHYLSLESSISVISYKPIELYIVIAIFILLAMVNYCCLFFYFLWRLKNKQQYEISNLIKNSTLYNTVLDAIILSDDHGVILQFNPAAERLFGWQAKEIIGQQLEHKIFAKQNNITQDQEGKHVGCIEESKILNKRVEIEAIKKDGMSVMIEMAIHAIKIKQRHIFIAFCRDIEDRIKNQQQLKQAQQKAEAANIAKSRFLAAVSHEIRTPMNAVLGALELLQETEINPQQSELIKVADNSGKHLLALINDVIDFSQMEVHKLNLIQRPFELYLLLRQVFDILQPQAKKKNLRFSLDIPAQTPNCLIGDQDRIRQVVMNLASNAIKYTDSGYVEMSVTCQQDNTSAQLTIAIKDSGIGISQEDIPKLFNEFSMITSSLKKRTEGSGLGLAISKQLAELMQGNIRVISEVGQGSSFEFTLPLPLCQEQTTNIEVKPNISAVNPNLRLLLAEDNLANQLVIRTMLEFSGLHIDIVGDGAEAVAAVRAQHYDIILMDISMPVMDGIAATKAIRTLSGCKLTPVIIAITAHGLVNNQAHLIEAGMNDVMAKPLTRAQLMACIAKWQPQNSASEKTATTPPPSPAVKLSPPHQLTTQAPLVNRTTIDHLIADTSLASAIELLTFYVVDAKHRVTQIEQALAAQDFAALEYQAHTLGSSALAYGNQMLGELCRQIEHHCSNQEVSLAADKTHALLEIAASSFANLQQTIDSLTPSS